ncbi:MAG: glycerol-3-phosphate acyltransferase [Ruminococcaceae bacterium]|nr:glycerol-3-phosphate acyltransferase [Oscillospiraceae bacterium]
MQFVISSVLGYLFGCISPSYIISRMKGFDIREKGTGNAGATNVMFTLGFWAGLGVLLFDIAKTGIVVRIVSHFFSEERLCPVITGITCALGHVFPFHMKFRGGKGTACLAGTVLFLTPKLFLPMVFIVFIVGIIFNYGSILPIVAVSLYPFLYYFHTRYAAGAFLLILLIPLLLFSHRKNFVNYKNGKESKFRDVVLKRDLDSCIERTGEIVCSDDADKLIEGLSGTFTESESIDAEPNENEE